MRRSSGMIPNAVVGKHIMDGVSLLQAWREYSMLTQTDMAERIGISQAGYAQIEAKSRRVSCAYPTGFAITAFYSAR